MAGPLIPILVGGGVLALLLLSSTESKAATGGVTTKPPPKTGGLPHRPLNKTNLPAGTVIVRVAPACDAQDRIQFPGCDNGLLMHTEPNASAATRVGPPGTLAHPFTGEEMGVLPGEDAIPEIGAAAGASNRWAHVVTPAGTGFVRVVDSKGRSNIDPTGEVIGGGAPPVAGWYPPWAWGPWAGAYRHVPISHPAWWLQHHHRRPGRPFPHHPMLAGGMGAPAALNAPPLNAAQLQALARGARMGAVGPFYPSGY